MATNDTSTTASDSSESSANNSENLYAEYRQLFLKGCEPPDVARLRNHPLPLVEAAYQRYLSELDNQAVLPVRASVNKLLAEINLVRQAAWVGWKKSLVNHVKTVVKQSEGGTGGTKSDTSTTTDPQSGDAAFLRVIEDCNKREGTLRGVEKLGQSLLQSKLIDTDFEALLQRLEAIQSEAAKPVSNGRRCDAGSRGVR